MIAHLNWFVFVDDIQGSTSEVNIFMIVDRPSELVYYFGLFVFVVGIQSSPTSEVLSS